MRLRFFSAFLDGSRFGINFYTHALAKTVAILIFLSSFELPLLASLKVDYSSNC